MRLKLALKGWIALIAVLALTSGGLAYATHRVFDVGVTGSVQVQIKVPEGVEVYEDSTLQMAVSSLAFEDVIPRGPNVVVNPGPIKVWVQNHTFQAVQVDVDDDYVVGPNGVDVTAVFGPTSGDLQPKALNAFELQPEGTSGDGIEGYVGLQFSENQPAQYGFNVIFRAILPPPP